MERIGRGAGRPRGSRMQVLEVQGGGDILKSFSSIFTLKIMDGVKN